MMGMYKKLFITVLCIGLLITGAVYVIETRGILITPPTAPMPAPTPTPTPSPTPEPATVVQYTPPPPEYTEVNEPYVPEYEYEPEPTGPVITTITINAVGDITWGGDRTTMGYRRFMDLYAEHGIDFFLYYTRDIFAQGDLNIANLEGTFTNSPNRREAVTWAFSAPPHMARGLAQGNIDVVTIANNHIYDFYRQGYLDTLEALRAAGVKYFGNAHKTVIEVNGIKVGLFGYMVYVPRRNVERAIAYLREQGAQIIIAYYHWGIMGDTRPQEHQRHLGRFTLDAGADLVLGAHPHNIQGIEVHNGRFIVYSLADFSYAGHANPADLDSFIFQKTFTFIDGELQLTQDARVLPLMQASARRPSQNFQPILAVGEDAARIRQRMFTYSGWLNSAENMYIIEAILSE